MHFITLFVLFVNGFRLLYSETHILVQTNTATLDDVSGDVLDSFSDISAVQCAVKCGADETSPCQSFLYNTETGQCNIYGAIYDDNPEGSTVMPWTYYTTVKDCDPASLSAPDNGNLVMDKVNYGATAVFSCDSGFKPESPVIATCQADGNWSETAIVCTVKRSKGRPKNRE